jgi:hypothetical protein
VSYGAFNKAYDTGAFPFLPSPLGKNTHHALLSLFDVLSTAVRECEWSYDVLNEAVIHCTPAPDFTICKLFFDQSHHLVDPSGARSTWNPSVKQHPTFIDMPSIPCTKIVSNTTSTIPTTNRVERIRQPTNSLGKVWTRFDSSFVIQYCITNASFVLDCVRKIGQRDIKILVTLYGLLVHLNGNI